MTEHRPPVIVALLLAVAIASGCSTLPPAAPDPAALTRPAPRAVLRATPIDSGLEERILALDPERISEADVRDTLARGPTPRIVLLHGGIYPVHLAMESFGEFLTGMGYPATKIQDPRDGSWSISPYASSVETAGLLAWYYEHDGVRPMVVGHSQGGIQTIKILHELAGSFGGELHAFNPYTGVFESQATIVDPLDGRERPVVGTSIAYASAIGAGGWALMLPNHWIVAGRLHTIPNAVDEFTAYRIGFDLFALDGPGLEGAGAFHADGAGGKALVRNVSLPAWYSHVLAPVTSDLARSPAIRAWINAYDPADDARTRTLPPGDPPNLLWAADVWHSLKRHWTLEAQRFVRARRALATG
jgi:hypothetical protein